LTKENAGNAKVNSEQISSIREINRLMGTSKQEE
jgi:hypothetical protein